MSDVKETPKPVDATAFRRFFLAKAAAVAGVPEEKVLEENKEQLELERVSLGAFLKWVAATYPALNESGGGVCTTAMRWDYTPEAIESAAHEVIAAWRAALDAVGAVAEGKHTFENTLAPLIANDFLMRPLMATLTFPQHVSADEKLRAASTKAEEQLNKFGVEAGLRVDVFAALQAFEKTEEACDLTGERRRLLERLLRDFRRNGVHLDEERRAAIKAVQEEMTSICTNFQKNLREDKTALWLSGAELAGLPDDVLAALKRREEDGKYEVTMDYPIYFPVMKYVKVDATRQAMEFAFNTRCKEVNTPLMARLVELRDQQAKILDFPTHAHFVTNIRMAKNPEQVLKFLEDLSVKLDPLVEKEMEVLLRYKKAEKEAAGEAFDGKINAWDMRYYMTQVEQRDFAIDHQAIKEYFPLDVALSGMLRIYETVLGLRFVERTITGVTPAIWHEEVRVFDVLDAAGDGDAKAAAGEQRDRLVGRFYLDLHPRPGKFNHAACWGLQGSALDADGKRQLPVSSVVCNFTRPTADAPALLKHDEVVTLFHEFGHCMHNICSETELPRFAGTAVERDFVEAPSQMLENFVWHREPLRQLSARLADKAPLPDDMIELLAASRNANVALLTKRQLVFALFDMQLHQQVGADVNELFAAVQSRVSPVPATPGTAFPASFGHLAGGYDASYYGYLWSEVFSFDLFERFKADGVISSKIGHEYRRKVLAKGGSVDGDTMLLDFLGRAPSPDAFLAAKGLTAAA